MFSTSDSPPTKTTTEWTLTIRDVIPNYVIWFSFLTIILGSISTNFCVIFAFYVTTQLKTMTGILFVSMSIAQMVMGGVVSCFAMIQTLQPGSTSGLACELPVYIELTFIACTIFSHIAVGVDRYFAVIHHTKRNWTPRTSVPVVMAIWIVSVLYSLRLQFQFKKKREEDKHFCHLFVEEREDNLMFRAIDFSCLFVVPLIALSFMYGRVMLKLWSRHRFQTLSIRRNRRVVKFLAISLLLFFLSWFPFYILDMVGDAMRAHLPESRLGEVHNSRVYVSLRYTFVLMAVGNCFVTPLIHIFFFPHMRRETKNAFLAMCRCESRRTVEPITCRIETTIVTATRKSSTMSS